MTSRGIAIVGAGANGASIGANLTRAGLDVTFIEQWPLHVEAMRENGVRVEMPDETLVTPVRAFHLCEVATLREAFGIVLVVVKAYDTRWACELIKPLVRPDGLVVGLQNGMTIDERRRDRRAGAPARRRRHRRIRRVDARARRRSGAMPSLCGDGGNL